MLPWGHMFQVQISTSPSFFLFHLSAINFLGTEALLFCCVAKLNLLFWGVKGFFVCGHGC
jgi:hypothetical protein